MTPAKHWWRFTPFSDSAGVYIRFFASRGKRSDELTAPKWYARGVSASDACSVRLTFAQIDTFQQEGRVVPTEPVFPTAKFAGLKSYFENLLDDLETDVRPELMDVPHFQNPELFACLMSDEVLGLVQPILGPDIALFSSHFICKPQGDGKRVPWHEDSAYWRGNARSDGGCHRMVGDWSVPQRKRLYVRGAPHPQFGQTGFLRLR